MTDMAKRPYVDRACVIPIEKLRPPGTVSPDLEGGEERAKCRDHDTFICLINLNLSADRAGRSWSTRVAVVSRAYAGEQTKSCSSDDRSYDWHSPTAPG